MRVVSCAVVLTALCALTGCGDGLNRQGVTGTVNYKGKPIIIGSITFSPLDPAGRTTGGAQIKNGKYEMIQATGLSPGKYRVCFTAMDKEVIGPAVPGDPGPSPKEMPKEVLPPNKYGSQSTIEAEVKSGGNNVLDFNLD